MGDLREVFDAYATTALWSTTDESNDQGGDPLEANYSLADLAPSAEEEMVSDCKRFLDRAWPLLEKAPDTIHGRPKLEMAGFHFWLARNGHGIGFDDGDWPDDVADKLQQLAKRFGTQNIYVGDDGMIYT
jgi:hypothetical protein